MGDQVEDVRLHSRAKEPARILGDMLQGCAPGSAEVIVSYNGQRWAQVRADPGKGLNYSCQLPAVAEPMLADVEISDRGSGRTIERLRRVERTPLRNSLGLRATDVLKTHMNPLFDPFNFVFDGAILTIYGSHLPPDGDPSKLSVSCNSGVSYTIETGLYSPDFGDHYWYWPNSHLSSFRLRIDLSKSESGSNPFCFTFIYRYNRRCSVEGETIYIPSDISSFVGYPSDKQITRVQTYDSVHSANFSGYHAYRRLSEVIARHYPDQINRLLDFGSGHGRIARHFANEWPNTHVSGIDVDVQNVNWCQDNLPKGDFRVGPLWPETFYETSHFDVLISVSVMTHFTAAAQTAWLREFHRLLKPGGLALLTFNGAGAAAYTSISRTPEWWKHFDETLFDDSEVDLTLSEQLHDVQYYRNTFQKEENVRTNWVELFHLEEVIPDFLGYQSLAVLRGK